MFEQMGQQENRPLTWRDKTKGRAHGSEGSQYLDEQIRQTENDPYKSLLRFEGGDSEGGILFLCLPFML